MVTAMIVLVDHAAAQIRVASAAHLPLFLIQPDETVVELPIRNGLP